MSFHVNNSQQYSLTDITGSLTSREQKALENSWAKIYVVITLPVMENVFVSMTEYKDAEFWDDAIIGVNGFMTGIKKEASEDIKKQFYAFMEEQEKANLEGYKV